MLILFLGDASTFLKMALFNFSRTAHDFFGSCSPFAHVSIFRGTRYISLSIFLDVAGESFPWAKPKGVIPDLHSRFLNLTLGL